MSAAITVSELVRVVLPRSNGLTSMLSAYFEDSGTHRNSQIVVTGGLIGAETNWSRFETAWKAKLADPLDGRKPPLREFHMAPCMLREGEFQGYSEAERNALRIPKYHSGFRCPRLFLRRSPTAVGPKCRNTRSKSSGSSDAPNSRAPSMNRSRWGFSSGGGGLRAGMDRMILLYLAKSPLIHWGFAALANQKVVGGTCRGNENRPKISAAYERSILTIASSILVFPPKPQLMLSICPGSISFDAP
jgi:hypothetical protein